METYISEYALMIVLWQVVKKLCVEKKWIPPGLSIQFLRYIQIIIIIFNY